MAVILWFSLLFHALCWLFLVLVRMDKASRERRFQQRMDSAKTMLETYRLGVRDNLQDRR